MPMDHKFANMTRMNQQWLALLGEVLTDQEIKSLAHIVKPSIAGFTPRNITKAPISLLRKHTLHKLKRSKTGPLFLYTWFEPLLAKYSETEMTFEDFCSSVQLSNQLTTAEILGVMGLNYPNSFQTHMEQISENMKNGISPVEGLITVKPSFEKVMQLKQKTMAEPRFQELVRLMLEQKHPEWVDQDINLVEKMKEQSAFAPGELAYLTVCYPEWEQWQVEERAVFLHFTLLNTFEYIEELVREVVDDQKEAGNRQKELEQQARDLTAQLQKLQTLHEQTEKSNEKLKKQQTQLEARLKDVQEHADKFEHLWEEAVAHNKQLQTALQAAEQRYEVAAASEKVDWVLVDEPDFLLLTHHEVSEFNHLINGRQVVTISHWHDVKEADLAQGTFLFIHSDGLTTQAQFQLDDWLRSQQRKFRYVSGSPVAAVRKIICYLEGDMLNEVAP